MRSTPFYGLSKGDEEIRFPSCPTLRAQAQALASARVKKEDPFSALIIPESWRGGERGNQFMVEVPPAVASRFSRVWGVIASCQDTESSGTPTHFLLNIVLELPFRFSEDRAQADRGIDIQIPFAYLFLLIGVNLPTRTSTCALWRTAVFTPMMCPGALLDAVAQSQECSNRQTIWTILSNTRALL